MGIRYIAGIVLAFLLAFSGEKLHGADAAGAGTPTVTHGGADFGRVGDNLTVTTHGDRTIINWDRFGVPGGSLTHFAQPGRNSATLNRVTGAMPSRIDGSLTSNGAVFLVNPRGVTVGPNGVVRTDGGFVASTMNLSDRDFINGATGGGTLRFMSPGDGSAGMAVNQGLVESVFGDVFFVGTRVDNSGTISAPLGTVGFAAGGNSDVVVQPMGGTGARFEIVPNANSFYDGNGVTNSGVVTAATAELIANGDAYRLAVNNSGLVSARGIDNRPDGSVYLTASGAGGATGSVVNMGTLRAVDADGSGGAVRMTAGDVRLASGSLVDVSAETAGRDGGVALIGGEFQGGKNLSPEEKAAALPNAKTTVVEAGLTILADGVGTGAGGLAVLWADESTAFDGHVSARGGEVGGDGGLVEVSGKHGLLFSGTVDTAAPRGRTGTLLLDPTDVIIANSGGTITPTALVSALGSNNVVVFTDATGTGDGNIFVNNDVEWSTAASGNNSLTLLAYNNIIIRANLRNFTPGASNTTSDVNTGDLTLVAGWDGSTGWTAGGGGSTNGSPTLPAAPTTLGELQAANWFGDTANRAAYTVGGTSYQGSIILDAADQGISIILDAYTNGANVGSRNGNTTLFGNNITLLGGDFSQSAHIGYALDDRHESVASIAHIASGDIGVYAKGHLSLAANHIGGGNAKIGHGANNISNGAENATAYDYNWCFTADSANIKVLSGNDITLSVTSAQNDVQIGHGGTVTFFYPQHNEAEGYDWNWSLSADSSSIMVEAGGDITLIGTGGDSYIKIGHGGQVHAIVGLSNDSSTVENISWNLSAKSAGIKVKSGGDITLNGSDGGFGSHVQIGHGGMIDSDAIVNNWSLIADFANIEILTGGNIVLTNDVYSFAQIGHGGIVDFSGTDNDWYLSADSANIDVTADGNITLADNFSSSYGYTQIGHGGGNGISNLSGNLVTMRTSESVRIGLSITASNITFDSNNVAIGHVYDGRPLFSGNIGDMAIRTTGGGITLSGNKYANLFHSGSGDFSLLMSSEDSGGFLLDHLHLDNHTGRASIVSESALTLTQSATTPKNISGNLHLIAGWDGVSGWTASTTTSSASFNPEAAIVKSKSIGSAVNNLILNAPIAITGSLDARAADDISVTRNLTIGGFGSIRSGQDLTIASTANIVGNANGTALLLTAGGKFLNQSSTDALTVSASGARWLVWTADPTGSRHGGLLNSRQFAYTNAPTVNSTTMTPDFPDTVSLSGSGFLLPGTAPTFSVKVNDATRLYGDENTMDWGYDSSSLSVSALVLGDTLSDVRNSLVEGTLVRDTDAGQFSNAGGAYYVNITSGLTSNLGYTLDSANNTKGALTVTRRPITVTADNKNRIYGDTNPLLTWGVTSGNLVNGDTLSGDLATTATVTSNVGDYAITQGTLAASSNYDMNFVDGTLTVTARPITVTADNKNRIYGDTNPLLTWGVTSGNLVNGDTLSGALATTAIVTSNVGDYLTTQGTLAASSNYNMTFMNGTLTVTARPITVTADNKNRIYGDPNPVLTWGVTSGNLVNGDMLSGALTTAAAVTSNVGSYAITQGALSAGSNYAMTFMNGALTVTPATLTVAANTYTREYGDANAPGVAGYTVSGWKGSDSAGNVTLTGGLSALSGQFADAGTYADAVIGSFTASSANYTVDFVPGDMVITPAALTVTANPYTREYGDLDGMNLANYVVDTTGYKRADDVATAVVSGNVAVNAGIGRFADVGTYNNAIGIGTLAVSNPNYRLNLISNTMTITPAPLRVSAKPFEREYGDTNLPDLLVDFYTYGWKREEDKTLNVTGTTGLTIYPWANVGTYDNAVTQNTLGVKNYTIDFQSNSVRVTPAPLLVTADDLSKQYNAVNPPLTWSATGFKLGEDEGLYQTGALGTDAMTDSTPGGYAIYQTTPFSFGKNYDVTFQEGTLTVAAHTETERPDADDNIVDYTPLVPEIPENQTPGSDGENFGVQPPSGDDFSGPDDGEANLPDGHRPGDDGNNGGMNNGNGNDDENQEDEDGDAESGEQNEDADDGESEESEAPGSELEIPADISGNGYPAVQGDVNRDGVVDVNDANNAANGDLGYVQYIGQNMTYDSPVFWWGLTQAEQVEYLKQHGNEMYNHEEDRKFQQLQQTFENWLNQGNNRELYAQHKAEIDAYNAKMSVYEKWTTTPEGLVL